MLVSVVMVLTGRINTNTSWPLQAPGTQRLSFAYIIMVDWSYKDDTEGLL